MSERLPTIEELKAMEKAATPGPWDVKSEDEHRLHTEWPRDEQLIVAMRNALPHLLAIADAANKFRDKDLCDRQLYTAVDAARAAGLFGEVEP